MMPVKLTEKTTVVFISIQLAVYHTSLCGKNDMGRIVFISENANGKMTDGKKVIGK